MPDNTIVIKAVGDICPGDKSILGLGVCSLTQKYGADFPLQFVQDRFKDADIVIGNLEGVLSPNAHTAQETFSGIPEFAISLRKTGFTVLNVANNHIMEKGISGFEETVYSIRKAGIEICGLRGRNGYYSRPVIINKNGISAGIIAYNWVSVDLFQNADQCIAQSHDSIVNYTWDRDPAKDRENREKVNEKNTLVIADIKRLKKEVDRVVLIPHWAYEFVHFPPYGTIVEAHSFIDAGADAIIGIHPHVLQGVEKYKNGIIAYSLGNFIFDSMSGSTKDSAILEISMGMQDGASFKFDFLESNSRFQPVPVSWAQRKKREKQLSSFSTLITAADAETTLNDEKVYRKFEKKYLYLKWHTVVNHFLLLPRHPAILLIILKKIGTFLYLVYLRLHGKKIRW